MNVLIACEFSGTVREAFTKRGHRAVSCDIQPTEISGDHYCGKVQDIIGEGWDLMIAFPPCTYLSTSGNRAFLNNPERWKQRLRAVEFVYNLMNYDIDKICIENPVGVISTHIRKPDQYIQPYEFGHTDSKKTGLWLKNIPLLKPTKIMLPEWTNYKGKRYSKMACSGSSKNRSRTYQGVANAMGDQWG